MTDDKDEYRKDRYPQRSDLFYRPEIRKGAFATGWIDTPEEIAANRAENIKCWLFGIVVTIILYFCGFWD